MALNDIVVPRENAQGQFEELILPDATASARGLLSSSDKTKLDGIAAGAEVNVNADWNASSGDAQILNKPASFTPTAHAASHASAGSDPLFDQDLNTTDAPTFTSVSAVGNVGTLQMDDYGLVWEGARRWDVETSTFQDASEAPVLGLPSSEPDSNPIQSYAAISFSGANAATNAATTRTNLGLGDAATADIGTGSTEVAAGDHGHGNLSSDGKLGSTAGLPVVTTTAGAVTTLALGTAGQILRTKSDLSGVEFADPSGGGSNIMQSIAVGFVLN